MKKIDLVFRTLMVFAVALLFSQASFGQDEGTEKSGNAKEDNMFHMNNMKIQKHGEDTTVIIVHHHGHDMDKEKNHCPFMCRRNKFNGHWAGIEIGWNGYVNPDFGMTFPSDLQYLNLNTARSMMVNINPFDLNLNLVKNHFGITSGLGLTFNNYYFTNSTLMIPDSSSLVAYNMVDQNGQKADMKVNKLTVTWLTLPVLFEYQTNAKYRLNSFHVGVGVVGGVRICSYTKQAFYARNTTYYLQDDNGKTVGSVYVDDHPSRTKSQYHLNPFKLDATMRIGWSFLNIFATYSITPMYLNDQGPELYPWTVGISLIGW
jgi:hypothetical protein